jgi:hypothetical protein
MFNFPDILIENTSLITVCVVYQNLSFMNILVCSGSAYFYLTHLQTFASIIFICNALLAIALDDDKRRSPFSI